MSDTPIKRVLRGGSWFNIPENLRSANRYRDNAGTRNNLIGFRLVYREPPVDDRRVLRGGSWINSPEFLRSAYRIRGFADDRDGDVGFRLVYRERPHD